ncbi:hypothetical protein L873DRAFT_1845914 [Choiromyces venosus 120613-1]|uniref:Uncharacterized protein n=1 Tax=Choiromyces venosus 120613-1 TaxID=1336337 RepID=A0A3N4JGQ8_9PEZI|nr:hypothetical protein L873DRAFT_1845914 [Choiromyces venosus 120613-1]
MEIPDEGSSMKPKATFSKQDSRYNPSPEERSRTQMMEDLGDHRIVNLPLSGDRAFGTAPPPNPEKGGALNARMALESDHVEAWAALFDPSLVIERNDGLGEGQSYRIGPNYLPTERKYNPSLKGSRHRSGSDSDLGRHSISRPFLGASGSRVARNTPIIPFTRGQIIPPSTHRTKISFKIQKETPPPTSSQQPRRVFEGKLAGDRIPPKRVITTLSSITPLASPNPLAYSRPTDSPRAPRKIPDNPSVNHWHTGNLMTANQDFYDYIQSNTGAKKSMDPPVAKVEMGENRNIQLASKPGTAINVSRKADSLPSVDTALHRPELQEFAEAAPTTVSGINGAAIKEELISHSVVVAGAEIVNQTTNEIAQEASQLVQKNGSDSGKKLSAISDAGSLESRQNNNPESQPHVNLEAIFESLEIETQLTSRALLGCSFDSHDYEIKEIFNETRLKSLTDKINVADNHLLGEMAKMYQFKSLLQDIMSRSEKMTKDFLKIKMEHDEFMVKQKRIAEMEAGKKAAAELARKNQLKKQHQVELRKEQLIQEAKRLEEKQRLEKRQEEKRQEEKRQEEKRQEEKRQEEKRQEEKRQEQLLQEAKRLKEKEQLEKRRQEEKRQEELKEQLLQEEKRLKEKHQVEKRRQVEAHQENTHREKTRREEKRPEENPQEKKTQEELWKERLWKDKLRLEAENLREQRSERHRFDKQRLDKWQQGGGPLPENEQTQKEKPRGLDRNRYEMKQHIEKQRLDKLLSDERIKAKQAEAMQCMEDHLFKLRQEKSERKRAQDEEEKRLARERLEGGKGLATNGPDENLDLYGRGRIEAENAHERFQEITQVRVGHSREGSSTRAPCKEGSHSVGTQRAAQGERGLALPEESSNLDNGKLSTPLFPYKLQIQLAPLFDFPLTEPHSIPSITAWVDRFTDPTTEIEKAICQHLSTEEMEILHKVEAYQQFLARAIDHHTRKLAKDTK